MNDPLWYKDAVLYELHVKAFFDGNDDGIGDFSGLTKKLDYLQWLGVDCIWLLPFFPSPLRDDGYDVADYRAVFADYGTLADVRRFLDEAHRRGMRVIADLVVNTPQGEQVTPLVAAEAVGEAGFFGRAWLGLKQLFGMA